MRRVEVVKQLSKFRVILALILAVLLIILLISACDIGGGQPPAPGPSTSGILAPPENTKVLASSPVQIQSGFKDADNISRVELLVSEPNVEEKLIRSDVPVDGVVLQEWIPQQAGAHTIKVRAFDVNNQQLSEFIRQIEIKPSPDVSLPQKTVAEALRGPAEFEPPTPTPTAVSIQAAPTEIVTTRVVPPADTTGQVQQVDAVIAVAAVEPSPTPESQRRFPPPPPVPGVPLGPTQAEIPGLMPPVCDAATYLGGYTSDTSRRVVITEPDDVPAKVVGGTTVFRAWRLQNTGTCTWGPGYELAFYGGRSMGSGGVAFESTFPPEAGRRNAIVDSSRLVIPEGKPNQVAILEVALNAPVTPGIHQSYWRMRNPHGVFFGPIIGVTMEVVRECQSGIYGAPVINKFEILGVGNVYHPTDPVNVMAILGDNVTLDWNIINATNFDIVIEGPTGNIESISTPDQSGRITFPVKELGRYTVTLYADNGSCVVEARVNIEAVPPVEEQFTMNVTIFGSSTALSTQQNLSYSPSVAQGSVKVAWDHFDQDANQFFLIAEGYKRVYTKECPVVDSIFGWKGHCYMTWSEWKPTGERASLEVGGQGDAQGAATVTNVEQKLCPASFDPGIEDYGVRFVMQALKNGRTAVPEYSNTVDVRCPASVSTQPTEIQGAGTTFNPTN